MGAEQEAIARSGGGSAADEALREAGRPGGSAEGGELGGSAGGDGVGGGENQGGDQGGSRQGGSGGGGRDDLETATVEGCNDQEKVARQLCEAATKEADPFLRAALWDEYNEYRKILARQ
jgi:hypothetical protein